MQMFSSPKKVLPSPASITFMDQPPSHRIWKNEADDSVFFKGKV